MKIVKRTDLIDLNENLKITVSDAISYLRKLPLSFIKEKYLENKNKLSIKYYQKMLIALMSDQVAYFQIMESTLASQMSHRLNYFKDFAVFQLENLLPKLANEENDLINEFYEDIWLVLLQVSNEFNISDETLKEWIILSKELKDPSHNLEQYINVMHQLFKDEDKMISGLRVDKFKYIVEESATDKEIRNFAKKFNIELPKSLQKHQIHNNILNGLNEKHPKKEKQNEQKLKDLTILELKRVAKDEGLDVSYEINKKSSIERLLEEYPFTNYQVNKEQPINLPPRIRFNLFGEVMSDNLKENVKKEPQIIYANSNEPSQVVYTNNGEPIHIHVYYDGVEHYQRNNEDKKEIDSKNEGWPLWLKILILTLSLILATIILVIFLDITTLFPNEESGFTKLIFDLFFKKR